MSSVVSIIIPVYNAAKYLSQCVSTLEEQSHPYIELIFVNDCSTDNSLEILEDFRSHLEKSRPSFQIHIISHAQNMGVAAARNTGLKKASGIYIYYVDADDYLMSNAVELLVKEAERTKADVVGCNWVLQYQKNGRVMHQPTVDSGKMAIEYMSKGIMRWNLWLFLVRREIYTKYNICFIPGENMGEDMMVMFKIMYSIDRVSMIDTPLYYYNQANSASLTKVYSSKHKQEVTANLREIENFILQNQKNILAIEQLNYLKLNIKLPLLISSNNSHYKEWKEWFQEANSYITSNNLISKRIKYLQIMAFRDQYWFLWLHYNIVIKFIYGIIYR